MKFKLLKQFDKDNIPVGDTFDMGDREYCTLDFDDSKISVAWLIKEGYIEPIIEKKRYEDLKGNDDIFEIDYTGDAVEELFTTDNARSQTFLTREEAEDEHKRREYAVRADKFVPTVREKYYFPTQTGEVDSWLNTEMAGDYMFINYGLAFRTREECEKAIKEHDLIRLFYTIR